MNWERVTAAANKQGARLGAKRIWPQQYGTSNGFGIVAEWEDRRKHPVMVSRQLPDSMSDEQLAAALSDAIDKLAVWRTA
jgi:hypothetical protein